MKAETRGSNFSPIRATCLWFDPGLGLWRHRPNAPPVVVNVMWFPYDGYDGETDYARDDHIPGGSNAQCQRNSGDEGLEEGWWEWVWSHIPVIGASVHRATHWISDVWEGIHYYHGRRHNSRRCQRRLWSFLCGRRHRRCSPHRFYGSLGFCRSGLGWDSWYDEDVSRRCVYYYRSPWWD